MNTKIKSIIESLLFVAGNPISIEEISEFTSLDKVIVVDILDSLKEEKYNDESGIVLIVNDSEACFVTNEDNYDYISKFMNYDKRKSLTNAASEVLSIIAYKQPVTKSEIDEIRGVKSDHILSKLVNEGFIYVSGQLESPGKPNLYNTTNKFLLKFNLESLEELPIIEKEEI